VKDLRKCKYGVETIREIEKDVNPALIDFLIRTRGDELNCENPVEPESEFCIFHDRARACSERATITIIIRLTSLKGH